jgi:hypothetical protein
MSILQLGLLAALALAGTRVVAAEDILPDAPSRIEVIPIQTMMITDERFAATWSSVLGREVSSCDSSASCRTAWVRA